MRVHFLGHYLGLSKHVEVLILSLLGILFTIFDTSLFNLKSNLEQVWGLTFDAERFSSDSQVLLKYVLTSIVLVRTFSVHAYLAFYIVMLWPALFEDRPKLILPWLIVGAVRSLVTTLTAYSCGLYICAAYKFTKPVCADFVLAEIVEYGPSIYTWFCVLSFYRQLIYIQQTLAEEKQEQSWYENETLERRKKIRSIYWDNSAWGTLLKLEDDDRHLISASTIENVLNHLSVGAKLNESRSLDSLLQTIATEAEKREIMTLNDELKEEFEGDEKLSVPQKIYKLLELSPSDISRARVAKSKRKTRTASDIIPMADKSKGSKSSSSEESTRSQQPRTKPLPRTQQLHMAASEKELRTISISQEDIYQELDSYNEEEQPRVKSSECRLAKSNISYKIAQPKRVLTETPEELINGQEENDFPSTEDRGTGPDEVFTPETKTTLRRSGIPRPIKRFVSHQNFLEYPEIDENQPETDQSSIQITTEVKTSSSFETACSEQSVKVPQPQSQPEPEPPNTFSQPTTPQSDPSTPALESTIVLSDENQQEIRLKKLPPTQVESSIADLPTESTTQPFEETTLEPTESTSFTPVVPSDLNVKENLPPRPHTAPASSCRTPAKPQHCTFHPKDVPKQPASKETPSIPVLKGWKPQQTTSSHHLRTRVSAFQADGFTIAYLQQQRAKKHSAETNKKNSGKGVHSPSITSR